MVASTRTGKNGVNADTGDYRQNRQEVLAAHLQNFGPKNTLPCSLRRC